MTAVAAQLVCQLDCQVALRIAKHAKQNFPHSAQGSLLGLDMPMDTTEDEDDDSATAARLEVTNCFGYKRKPEEKPDRWNKVREPSAEAEAAWQKDFLEFQYNMIEALGKVGEDANAVGWYESTHHGNFLTEAFIEQQYNFQMSAPNSVVVVYDEFQQRVGRCGFKAYRLTQEAMMHREMHGDSDDIFREFPAQDQLLEDVPITIYTSPMVEAMLLQVQETDLMNASSAVAGSGDYNAAGDQNAGDDTGAAGRRNAGGSKNSAFGVHIDGAGAGHTTVGRCEAGFDLDNLTPALERNVGLLLDSLDDFGMHQREMQYLERQGKAGKDAHRDRHQRVPKHVDSLNLTKQIQEHCGALDKSCADAFQKLYLVSKAERGVAASVLSQNAEGGNTSTSAAATGMGVGTSTTEIASIIQKVNKQRI